MVLQNYQNLIEMTSNIFHIVGFGVGIKCPHKMHLNTQCPPPLRRHSLWTDPYADFTKTKSLRNCKYLAWDVWCFWVINNNMGAIFMLKTFANFSTISCQLCKKSNLELIHFFLFWVHPGKFFIISRWLLLAIFDQKVFETNLIFRYRWVKNLKK